MNTFQQVCRHYESVFGSSHKCRRWTKGPVDQLPAEFCVLEFPPLPGDNMWTYATVGMSIVQEAGRTHGLELHLHSPDRQEAHVELLTMAAYFHVTTEALGWHHTVDFGRRWYPDSTCSFGLITLPYLFGPALEWLEDRDHGYSTRFLWLIPITGAERSFIIEQDGAQVIEELFEQTEFNYLDPRRPSVI